MGRSFAPSPFGTCNVQSPFLTLNTRSPCQKSPGKPRAAVKARSKVPSHRVDPALEPQNSAASFAGQVTNQNQNPDELVDVAIPRSPRNIERNRGDTTLEADQGALKARSKSKPHPNLDQLWCGLDYKSSEGTSSPRAGSEIDPFSRPSSPLTIPKASQHVPDRPAASRDAVQELAKKHKIPEGYSLNNWDPEEAPILLLGCVFDCNSLGKWIYDWTIRYSGPGSPTSNIAGELRLLLTQLAWRIKRAEQSICGVDNDKEREVIRDFLEAGDRLIYKLYKLLKKCERSICKAADKSRHKAGKNVGIEFVKSLFGRERQLERTEKFMANLRLFSIRFDANCGYILKTAEHVAEATSSSGGQNSSHSEQNDPPSPWTPETQSSGNSSQDACSDGSGVGSPDSMTSLDTESTAFSDISGELRLDVSHPFYGEISTLTKLALVDFEVWMESPRDDETAGETASRSTGTEKDSSSRSRRRPRSQDDRAGGNADDGAADGNKRRKSGGNAEDEDEGLCLACPYYKLDRFKHHDCLKYRLKRVKDVKQHLFRIHKQAHYCPSCGLEFDTQTQQVEHSRVQQCRIREYPRPDGITQDQRDELSSRVDRKLAIDEQWFTVWDIVFRDRKRPKSPYVDTAINEMLSNFREFWAERGPEIVADHLRSQRELSYSMADEERSLAMLHSSTMQDAMGVLVDRFLASYSASTGRGHRASDAGPESASGNPSIETTSTDEGVADVQSILTVEDLAESQGSFIGGLHPTIPIATQHDSLGLPEQPTLLAESYNSVPAQVDQEDWAFLTSFDVGTWAADSAMPYGAFEDNST